MVAITLMAFFFFNANHADGLIRRVCRSGGAKTEKRRTWGLGETKNRRDRTDTRFFAKSYRVRGALFFFGTCVTRVSLRASIIAGCKPAKC